MEHQSFRSTNLTRNCSSRRTSGVNFCSMMGRRCLWGQRISNNRMKIKLSPQCMRTAQLPEPQLFENCLATRRVHRFARRLDGMLENWRKGVGSHRHNCSTAKTTNACAFVTIRARAVIQRREFVIQANQRWLPCAEIVPSTRYCSCNSGSYFSSEFCEVSGGCSPDTSRPCTVCEGQSPCCQDGYICGEDGGCILANVSPPIQGSSSFASSSSSFLPSSSSPAIGSSSLASVSSSVGISSSSFASGSSSFGLSSSSFGPGSSSLVQSSSSLIPSVSSFGPSSSSFPSLSSFSSSVRPSSSGISSSAPSSVSAAPTSVPSCDLEDPAGDPDGLPDPPYNSQSS